MKINFLTLFIALIHCTHAQVNILDQTFGNNGYVATNIGGYNYLEPGKLTIQPDGKIIAYSDDVSNIMVQINSTSYEDAYLDLFSLFRYNPDGTFDQTFGVNGKIQLNLGITGGQYSAVAQQQDGKILMSASIYTDSVFAILLMRFNNNGTIDSSFGVNGRTFLPDTLYNFTVFKVLVQPDEKIIVCSSGSKGMVRYLITGVIDTSFGVNGIVHRFLGVTNLIGDIILQASGKIILERYVDNAIICFNNNGTINTSFHFDGYNLQQANIFLRAICTGDNGSIVVAGDSAYSQFGIIAGPVTLIKLDSTGKVDSTFNGNGVVFQKILSEALVYGITSQPDGKILVLMDAAYVPTNNFFGDSVSIAVARFTAQGQLDSSFANNGFFLLDTSLVKKQSAKHFALQSDGKIVVLGSCTATYTDILIFRLLNDLSLGVVNFTSEAGALQVYPNPIHQQATLSYQLAGEEMISIALYDMEGKKVEGIINNELQPKGKYAEPINFNENVTAGNYILRLSNSTGGSSVKIAVK